MPDSTVYTPKEFQNFLDTATSISESEKANIRSILQEEQVLDERKEPSWLDNDIFVIFLWLIVIGMVLRTRYEIKKWRKTAAQKRLQAPPLSSGYFIYKGADLDLDPVTLEIICLKYNTFYRALDRPDQQRFLRQLQRFMQQKQFWMYSEDCYKEMPVLLSATAVQLSFGLPDFYLKSYPIIVIRPQAYLGFEPLRILTGNVQGNTITVSWEHFLKDNLDAEDGNNVGLHEMAHAFAMQLLYAPGKTHLKQAAILKHFYEQLEDFTSIEKKNDTFLFDAYALQNADECWAKCIELYFEKRTELEHSYPEIFRGIQKVLQQ